MLACSGRVLSSQVPDFALALRACGPIALLRHVRDRQTANFSLDSLIGLRTPSVKHRLKMSRSRSSMR